MKIFPDFQDFAAGYGAGRTQVVWTTLLADLETPVSAMLKLADGLPNSFLLESVEGGSIRGRYSFIGLRPDLIWRCFGDRAEINRRALDDDGAFQPCPVGAQAGAIASLRALAADSRIGLPPGLPPMAAGLVGYMSYDVVRLVERLPQANPDVLGTPDGIFLRPHRHGRFRFHRGRGNRDHPGMARRRPGRRRGFRSGPGQAGRRP